MEIRKVLLCVALGFVLALGANYWKVATYSKLFASPCGAEVHWSTETWNFYIALPQSWECI